MSSAIKTFHGCVRAWGSGPAKSRSCFCSPVRRLTALASFPLRCVAQRPILTPPVLHPKTPMRLKLHTIQQFIKCFEYNHTGTSYFKKRRDRGSHHVMLTAKEIIREALPIQCVEAVFLALFLTAGMSDVSASFALLLCSHRHLLAHFERLSHALLLRPPFPPITAHAVPGELQIKRRRARLPPHRACSGS